MMGNTDSQNLAITTIDRNVAVNAGAGTGKTKVLTERYIYILENGKLEKGKEVESIVAITFTKKATGEMKERIRDEIKNRFSKGNKWKRYYRDMEKANISTIHSFCGSILKDNALEAEIDPMFTVLDDNDGDLLLEETILELLTKGIEKDKNIYNMIRLFGRDDLTKMVPEIKSVYYKIRTVGYTFEEVKNMTLSSIDNIKVNFDDIKSIKDDFIYLMGKSRKGSKIYKLQTEDIWMKFYKDEYFKDELVPILEYLLDNIGTNSKETDRIEKLGSSINKVLMIKEKQYRWVYETILELLIGVDKEYTRKKDELGVLDYDDLQILVLKLLDNESIRQKYQDKFKYIMVDEFQDTNELQKKIFYKLCTKDKILDRSNLFIVGDPKQSIYGFRGADLEVFYDVMDDIEKVSNQKTITLEKNFRTVDTIITVVNNLFQGLMGDRYNALKSHHISKNKIDVEILEKEDLIVPSNIGNSDYSIYYESRLIASRIKELVDEGQFNYGDFALLFRASTMDNIYEDALREYEIPYYNMGGKGFYQGQEIIDLLNGIKAISNGYDTISTIGFLRGPMIGLSDKTIYWLLRYKRKSLIHTLNMDIPYIEGKEKGKVVKAEKLLKQLMAKKDLYGVYPLLNELINETYYLEGLLLHQGGRQLVSNVYKFLEIARKFDKEFVGSLEDFIDYIEKLKHTDESQAKIQGEDADAVKIMTIHKSKGLQFPVVVIPQMARGFNYQQPNILFNKDKGISLKYDNNPAFYNSMKGYIRNKEDEENKRILYVAMTRAEKKLIIGNQGKSSGFKKLIKNLIDINQVEFIDKVNSHGDERKAIKLIDDKLLSVKPFDNRKLLLLREMPGYNQKTFNSFNISQYIEFKQCKRRFFMKYYKRLPIDGMDKSKLEEEKETMPIILDPATKGNLIHKFCEYYRSSMEPRRLMAKVANSFGMEYNDKLEGELAPYIKNYLKHYKEEYDKIYTEKSFYLRIEDVYINGIIDRINIKSGKAEIMDFKTNKIYDNKTYLIKNYEPQLQLYANAFQKIANMEVKRARIFFLETGEIEEIDISKEALRENYRDIRDFIAFVTKNNNISKYEKTSNCTGNCKYNIFCNLN
jgi:ATP-dependent helicase/nuclease subunit A